MKLDLSRENWESHAKWVGGQLNEKHRRWVAGWLSEIIGWGGTKQIAKATGLDPKTIRQGRLDWQEELEAYSAERIRREGGGRPPLKNKDATLEQELIEWVEPETGPDPQNRCQYTRSRWRSLAKRLGRGSATTRGHWLKALGYSLKTNVKRLMGKVHPQRDWQYRVIQRAKAWFLRAGQPVIRVDANKSELIGDFKNSGQRYCQTADEVKVYDFPSEAQGQATPYGIYDNPARHALVSVGQSAVTSEFAVASIRDWWKPLGAVPYPKANPLLIEADAGGGNGPRTRLWKGEWQQLADDIGWPITVCHYPSGASQWNPIEHRRLSQISRHWAGHPWRTLTVILNFLRGTTTSKGLKVDAQLDTATYAKGIKVSDQPMKSLTLHRRRIGPDLSDTLKPRKSGNSF